MPAQSTRQLYPPAEKPFEPIVGGQVPNQIYPDDSAYPLSAGEPGFLLGNLFLELPGVFGVLLQCDVLHRNPLRDEQAEEGIVMGDITEVPAALPTFFWEPTEFYPVMAPVGANRQLTIQFRDFAQKHPRLKRPYRVTTIIEFVEKHPEVEAIPDAHLRERIYADLMNSDFTAITIDIEKYKADPTYSAVAAIRQTYANFLDKGFFHPNIETIKL